MAKKGIKFSKSHRLALSKAAKARYAGKKRGVKPGTKRGKYKKPIKAYLEAVMGNLPEYNSKQYTPSPTLTLCGQLEDAILLLENRVSNAIAKINSLM